MNNNFWIMLLILTLLKGINNRDPESLKILYEKWHKDLLAIIRFKVRDMETAEDLLQEAFLSFIRSLEKQGIRFSTEGKVRNYLITIALNKIKDHYRVHSPREKKQILFKNHEELSDFMDQIESDSTPERELMEKEKSRRLQELTAYVMAALPEKYREILALKFNRDLGNKEISELLGIGIKAVESLLHRAKNAFKKEFEQAALEGD